MENDDRTPSTENKETGKHKMPPAVPKKDHHATGPKIADKFANVDDGTAAGQKIAKEGEQPKPGPVEPHVKDLKTV